MHEMRRLSSEVLVVGARPAGLAAAIVCAQAGLQTTLLVRSAAVDNALTPLQSLHPRVELLLQQLNATAILSQAVVSRFDRIWAGSTIHHFSPYTDLAVYGYHVRRRRFDNALLEHARTSGVQILPDSAVVDVLQENGRVSAVKTRKGTVLTARWILDATGYARTLARRLRTVTHLYSPPLIVRSGILRAEAVDHEITRTKFEAYADGWRWFTSAHDNQLSWTALHPPTASGRLTVDNLVRQSIPGSVFTADARWRLTRPLSIQGMLIIGEAAGRLDPSWGQGITHALESGITAAQAIISSADAPALEPLHQAEYDSWFVSRYKDEASQLRYYYEQQGITLMAPDS